MVCLIFFPQENYHLTFNLEAVEENPTSSVCSSISYPVQCFPISVLDKADVSYQVKKLTHCDSILEDLYYINKTIKKE